MAKLIVLLTYVLCVVHGFEDAVVFEDVDNDDVYRRVISTFFTFQEQECFKAEKFLYEPDNECYTVLSTGPCGCKAGDKQSGCEDGRDRWLVLEHLSNGRMKAVCRPCRCCDRPLFVYMAEDGQCHHRLRELSRFCPHNGTELRDNMFGEGECSCIRSPPHAPLLGDSSGVCYPLYHRGPCIYGETLVPDRDPTTLEAVGRCDRDPCALKGDGYAQWKNGDGKCYQLGSQGPCDNQSKFNVQRTSRIPDCIQSTNVIISPQKFTGPPPANLPIIGRNFALDLKASRGRRKTNKS